MIPWLGGHVIVSFDESTYALLRFPDFNRLFRSDDCPDAAARATFGTVVAVGGQASDEALDETRGLLYIANFTANRIDVMSTADNTIQTSINVAAQPGSLALSRDSQYLLVAHFNNGTPPVPSGNLLTLIHLSDNTQRTFITGDPPLGVAFFATVPENGPANFSGPGRRWWSLPAAFIPWTRLRASLQVVSTLANLATALQYRCPLSRARFCRRRSPRPATAR